MKTIVTHQSPDLDSVTSSWMIKRFLPSWADATLTLIPAGTTLNGMAVDSDPDILHTDTGYGKYDHHHLPDPEKKMCAAERVYHDLLGKKLIPEHLVQPLGRIANYTTIIDHLGEIDFPDPLNDRYDFGLHQVVVGMRRAGQPDPEIYQMMWSALDGVLVLFTEKGEAEQVLATSHEFDTKWGKGLAINSENTAAITMALLKGYAVVVQKSPQSGNARIKSRPTPKIDLTPVHDAIVQKDKTGEWFLHISKNMLLNGSSKGAPMNPTPLSLDQLVAITSSIT
jgi:hypothetical protein